MNEKNENLTRELRKLDPVEPGELDGVARGPAASRVLASVLASDPGATGGEAVVPRRRRRPILVLAPLAAAAAAVVLLLVVGISGGGRGGGGDRLAAALGRAERAASTQAEAAADLPYTYLKTRETSVETASSGGRSWAVLQPTTREEWVAGDGSGRLRVVSGPARFLGADDRAAWEAAGRPSFLPLGFDRRTEDRWLSAGTLGRSVEELSTDPVALATHLRYEAEGDPQGLPVPAATLQLIAEDLRDPGASPALRAALYAAARRVPGIEYLGPRTDPEGREGVAIGLRATSEGQPRLYSLIFDPDTSRVLAGEIASLEPRSAADPDAPRLLRAQSYVESLGIETMSGAGKTWLSAFGSPAPWGRSPAPYLIYDVAGRQ
jgi:hypothetical protein